MPSPLRDRTIEEGAKGVTFVATINRDQWLAVRASVQRAGERFADLVAAAPRPDAMATAHWSVAETAAHVAGVVWLYTDVLPPGTGEPAVAALAGSIPQVTVDTVAEFNNLTLRYFTERAPRTIAARLRTDIDRILRGTEHHDPAMPVPWLGGSTVPLAGVLAHLANELLIHGRDIARALGTPWFISRPDAALFFNLFLLNVLNDVGRLVDTTSTVGRRRVAVEFRSRYTTPAVVTLDNGRITVQSPATGADMRVHFDPPTLNLMLFGRISTARAALTGKVLVWGPRPWLLPSFLRVVRLPSNALPLTHPDIQPHASSSGTAAG